MPVFLSLRPTLLRTGISMLVLLAGTNLLPGAILHVDHAATGTGDGSSWSNAYPQLQSALAVAASGDEIWVAEGTYYPDEGTGQTDNNRQSSFRLRNGVALYGGFTTSENNTEQTDRHPFLYPTILSGDLLKNDASTGGTLDNAYHVVTGSGTDATAVLDGFHVTAGHANAQDAPDNAGGGLICNNGGAPTISNCAFTANRAADLGGAIYVNDSSHPSFTNCSFAGNHVFIIGGAICITNSSQPSLVNCTFAGNSADGLSAFGGAIYSSPSSAPILINSILWNNTATTDGDQVFGPLGPSSTHNLVQGAAVAGHVISASDPLFTRDPSPGTDGAWTALADNDYGDLQLRSSSPAVNAGLNAANSSSLDLASRSRLQNGLLDLGAYEQPFQQTVTNTSDSGPGSLREAIATIQAPGGGTITLDPSITGQNITLTSGQLLINKSLVIDGSALSAAVTIDADQGSRVFEITSGVTAVLDTIIITGGATPAGTDGADGADQPGGTGGNGAPGEASGNGGGILNAGNLTLNRVTVTGNHTGPGGRGGNAGSGITPGLGGNGGDSGHGGGIYNTGHLVLMNCTIAANHTSPGGNAGTGSGNVGGAGGSGGGIYNAGQLTLIHATITDNAIGSSGSGPPPIPGSGGGLRQLGDLFLQNTIIAENTTAAGGPDLHGTVTTPAGVNFIGNPAGALGLGPDVINGDPGLSPLAYNGGPTPTRSPFFDSPAVDPANGDTTSRLDTDQRGVHRIVSGIVDIGAVEALLSIIVSNTNDAGTGSLRDSLLGVENGGRIQFDASLDGSEIVLAGGELHVDRSVTIDASDLPAGITLNAGQQSRVMTIDDGQSLVAREVVLEGVTISGGRTPGNGGGISNCENLTLRDCTITGNAATGHSGGIWFACGTSLMENCVVRNNSAASAGGGGGIRVDTGASLVVVDTAFRDNSATNTDFTSRGGGSLAALAGSTLTVTRCSFHEGIAGFGGGAVSLSNDATFTDCVFAGNTAPNGGAAYLVSANPTLLRCRFTENTAPMVGGAICMTSSSNPVIGNTFFLGNSADQGGATFHADSSPAFTSCVFSGNQATTAGGAVDNSASPATVFTNCSFAANTGGTGGAIFNNASAPTLAHCILWGNSATIASPQIAGGVSLSSARNLIQDGGGPHVTLTADPRFVDAPHPGPDGTWAGNDDNNYGNLRLFADSPAIDAGSNTAYDAASTLATDIVGKPRKTGTIDLGAYEGPYFNFALTHPTLDPNGDANRNGIRNVVDYASGADPEAPHDNLSIPRISGRQLQFSHRPDPFTDTVPVYERSGDLITWEPMVEGTDYSVQSASTVGNRTTTILDLLDPDSPQPKAFYRTRFPSIK